MRTMIVVALYLFGVAIHILWMTCDKEEMRKNLFEPLSKDPAYSAIPSSFVATIITIVILVMSLLWPLSVIKTPFDAIINIFKKDESGE